MIVETHSHIGDTNVFDVDLKEADLLATFDANGVDIGIVMPSAGCASAPAIHDRIAKMEAILANIKLGIYAEVLIYEGTDERDSVWKTYLIYRKGHSGWALYVKDVVDGDENWTPLRDASRDDRVVAVKAFPKLLEALKESAERELTNIREATQAMV